jgi:hypothetical protein
LPRAIDNCCQQFFPDPASTAFFRYGHLAELKAAVFHREQCTATDGSFVEDRHHDFASRPKDVFDWIAEHFQILRLDREKLPDPGFVEFAKGSFVAGLEWPEYQ